MLWAFVDALFLVVAVDLLFRGVVFSSLRLVAAVLVIVGFALMMAPDSWNLPFHRRSGVKSARCYGNESEDDDDHDSASSLR